MDRPRRRGLGPAALLKARLETAQRAVLGGLNEALLGVGEDSRELREASLPACPELPPEQESKRYVPADDSSRGGPAGGALAEAGDALRIRFGAARWLRRSDGSSQVAGAQGSTREHPSTRAPAAGTDGAVVRRTRSRRRWQAAPGAPAPCCGYSGRTTGAGPRRSGHLSWRRRTGGRRLAFGQKFRPAGTSTSDFSCREMRRALSSAQLMFVRKTRRKDSALVQKAAEDFRGESGVGDRHI